MEAIEEIKFVGEGGRISPFGSLPNETIIKIALDLDVGNIKKLCKASRRFNKVLCVNKNFWKLRKISLKRVTVDLIRERYWDPITRQGRPISMYAIQDYEGGPVESGEITFIPDGTLIHKNFKLKIKKVYPDWLSIRKSDPHTESYGKSGPHTKSYGKYGPYAESDYGKSLNDFYYLGGRIKGLIGKGFYLYALQICTKPINILSTDCLDAVDVWVRNS